MCKKFDYRTLMNTMKPQITMFMDWTDESLEELGDLDIKYSGFASLFDPIEIKEPEYHLARQPHNFCEGSLMRYSLESNICATSWATSIIEIVNHVSGKKLSVEQLLHCLPQSENINGCKGVHPKTIAMYLMEVGLVEENSIKDGDSFVCEKIYSVPRYRFTPVYPESPNAGGLMNLIAEGTPVFTMVSLDLTKLRFIKDMSNIETPYKCSDYQPSMYGIVSGYKYDQDFIEDSYWEVVSSLVGCEEMMVRLPMTANMTNGNYAGIAAYAFTLDVIDIVRPSTPTEAPPEVPTEAPTEAPTEVPTIPTEAPTEAPTETPTEAPTEPPTPTPTPTAFLTGNCLDLVISDNEYCGLLFIPGWKTIRVEPGICYDYYQDLTIIEDPCLEELSIGGDSFNNLIQVNIGNNPKLKSLVFDTLPTTTWRGAMNNVHNLRVYGK